MESELSILVSLTMHLGLYAIKILYISFALWHGIAKKAMVQSQLYVKCFFTWLHAASQLARQLKNGESAIHRLLIALRAKIQTCRRRGACINFVFAI
jgi:hypothetical protein